MARCQLARTEFAAQPYEQLFNAAPPAGPGPNAFAMALKRIDRGQFPMGADRLLELLFYPALRSRERTGRQNCCLGRAIGGVGAHTNLVFHEFGHGLRVTDRAEGRLKLFAAIDEFF